MKRNKVIILTSIIVGVLVVTLGLTYAALMFNQTKGNSQLVLGDIWMHYNETNQLVLNDAMPMDINDYITYKVNTVMASQSVDYKNELTACVYWVLDFEFDSGSTPEKYCKGVGTAYGGYTFQNDIDDGIYGEELIQELVSKNIVVLENDTYIINPIMTTQTVKDVNELSRCISYYYFYDFDEGSDAESFCKGTGTTLDGLTIQQDLDGWLENSKEYDYDFLEVRGQELLDAGVILQQIENLPYFEFTIDGKNTYTKEDIIYDIVLNHGDEHSTRTTRIRDDLLRFRLVEVVEENETVLLDNKSYSDLKNKRIYVDTIPANTNEKINRTYRLYMWISEDTVIGNINQDYTIEEWNDVYASIKVNVTGDFNEKEYLEYEEKYNVTDASCFFTEDVSMYIHNKNMTEEELNICSTYLSSQLEPSFYDGETITDFCRGVSTYSGWTFQNALNKDYFNDEQLAYLEENNIIYSKSGLAITGYVDVCKNDVVIPKLINNEEVIYINNNAFNTMNLTSVVLPNTVLVIDEFAFINNQLVSVIFEENSQLLSIGHSAFDENYLKNLVIPNSVIYISTYAFHDNLLENLTFEENSILKYIDFASFTGNSISNVTIPTSVKHLDCEAFDENVIIIKSEDLVCYQTVA